MNPRDYPDVIISAESGRPLYRGVKRFEVNGKVYYQPGWWASLDDPFDTEGQLIDEDNTIWGHQKEKPRRAGAK